MVSIIYLCVFKESRLFWIIKRCSISARCEKQSRYLEMQGIKRTSPDCVCVTCAGIPDLAPFLSLTLHFSFFLFLLLQIREILCILLVRRAWCSEPPRSDPVWVLRPGCHGAGSWHWRERSTEVLRALHVGTSAVGRRQVLLCVTASLQRGHGIFHLFF